MRDHMTAIAFRRFAGRLALLGIAVLALALFGGTAAGIGTHDTGFVYVLIAEYVAIALVGLSALCAAVSFLLPRAR